MLDVFYLIYTYIYIDININILSTQWLDPSPEICTRDLDPGLVALSPDVSAAVSELLKPDQIQAPWD